jgi:hypothetical protein
MVPPHCNTAIRIGWLGIDRRQGLEFRIRLAGCPLLVCFELWTMER